MDGQEHEAKNGSTLVKRSHSSSMTEMDGMGICWYGVRSGGHLAVDIRPQHGKMGEADQYARALSLGNTL
jgi:hypothetical protein